MQAIGAIVWATVLASKINQASLTSTLIALLLSTIGMAASLVHLGKPIALTSMSNLASSG